ncbi:MAG: histidine phosphatase family protein [Acidobacteria bacterium]|nr:histidine phosphatase family protein [Acidobacteriota bacterium]
MRHAKSSWIDTSMADFDRPLNERGRRAAPFMGEIIATEGLLPDFLVSSPAKRTTETANLVQAATRHTFDVHFDARIYEASAEELLQVVSEIPDRSTRALLVGHNPACEQILRMLTGAVEPMPTAALAVIELEIASWNEIAPASGKLRRLVRPREDMRRT